MSTRLMTMKPKAVSGAEFKARCLALFDEVETHRRAFVITKRGRPVARVVPLDQEKTTTDLQGTLLYEEDLVSPVGAEWDAVATARMHDAPLITADETIQASRMVKTIWD